MDSPLLWLGTLACALAAAGALLPLARRHRLALISAALVLAPILIAGDNWNSERVVDLRDSPGLLAAAGLAGAAGLAAATRLFLARPTWLPLALIAVMPFRIPVELGDSTANLLIPLYGLLAAGVIAAWLQPERVLPRAPAAQGPAGLIAPALALVVLAYGLQAGYADDISTAVKNVGFFFAPFAALYLLVSTAPWDRGLLRAALLIAVAEGLLIAVIGFGQAVTTEIFWNEKVIDGNEAHAYFRVNSLFFDPNIMGRYLAVTMIFLAGVVGWSRPEMRKQAWLAAAAFTALLAALVLTYSQTSMLALIAGVAVLLAAVWGIPRALAAGALVVVALAAAVFGLGGGGLTAETTGRTGLVSGGLEIAEDRPLTGYGSGTFAEQFEGRFGAGDGIAVESHTEPVTIAAEQGAIGLLTYLALIGVAGLALVRATGLGMRRARDPLAATLLAAFAGMLVHSLGYAAFFTDPITWVLLGLTAALPAMATAPAPVDPTTSRAPEPEAV